MPRKKQQNPQPVKLDSEDGVGVNTAASLTFESDFLLGQDLDFSDVDNDSKIVGLEKFSGDDETSSFSHFSMESDTDDRTAENDHKTGRPEPTFGHYLSCRGCARLLDDDQHSCLPCFKRGMASIGDGTPPVLERTCAEGAVPDDGQPRLHSCLLCGFSSRYTNHVKRHMKTHNGEKPYRCSLCSYASAQLVNLQRHLRIHTGEKPYKCEYCTFACSSLGNLKRHKRMHTDPNHAPNTPQSMPKVISVVQNPYQRAQTIANLGHNTLQQMHKAANPAQNAQRNLGCPSEVQNLNEDAPCASKDEAKASIGNDSRYLKGFASLKLENQSYTPSQAGALPPLLFPFTCRLCGLELDAEDGSSAQICAKCTLEMLTKDAAESSGERGHRGSRVYSCAACPFLTHYPNHLARHMKTHSGEKPYKCPQCPYASAHFDNLKRHHRVHTGEKPYKCHLCDYACGNLANLKRHQRVHSGAKPFQCSLCSYSCNQSMNLKRHMLRHTGEKPHKCRLCTYTTGHWDNYKRHQKKHESGEDGWEKEPLPVNEEPEDEEVV